MADLEIRNLHVRAGDKPILRGLDLAVSKGEIHALMGPNGSGKSTLANVIMGQPTLEVTEGDLVRRMELQSETGLASLEVQLYCREWGFPIRWGVTHVRPRLSGESKVMNARTMFRTFVEMAKLRRSLRRRRKGVR